MQRLAFLIITIVCISLFSNIPTAEPVLWDLLITVNLEKDPLEVHEKPVVIGTIVDHAGKPVTEAEVKIRFEKESVITSTDAKGDFRYEFEEWQGNPGRYIVNVMATSSNDKIGLASTTFLIRGPISISSQSSYNLELNNLSRFENINPDELEGDPIELILYNYYQDLKSKYLDEVAKQKELEEYQAFLEQQRAIEYDLQQKIIEEKNPGAGTYSGPMYDQYVSNLDLTVKDIIVNQLNYTIIMFTEAQLAMEEVLKNGGTLEEARQAYYEKASIPRDLMNSLTTINTTEIENSTSVNSMVTETDEKIVMNYNSTMRPENYTDTLEVNVNATMIQVGMGVTTIFLNVNGTIVELMVNGTEISQVINSSSN